ncbi:MAG: hypothetical protein CME06_14260 [Gemmatimonadetes bacterium]|nr:hypothetical protein [Gemmatimonadota bacterium]
MVRSSEGAGATAITVDVPAGGSVAVEDSMILPPSAPLGRYLCRGEVEGLARDEREVWVE